MARVEVEAVGGVGAADRAAVVALLEAEATDEGARPMSDEQWLALRAPAGAGGPGAPAVGLVARQAPGGRLAGYAQLLSRDGTWALEAVVGSRGEDPAAVEASLLDAALGEVSRRGGGDVRLWLPAPGPDLLRLATGLGFAPERDLRQLRVSLPLDEGPAPGVEVRPFVPGRDDHRWLAVNNRAFAAHPEQGSWTLDDLLRREQEPWFDPAGFLLHDEGDRLAAFCWTKVHRGHRPAMGEIYVIGVDPDFQGRGLGRALAVAGLDHLGRQGITVGMLYVDGDNQRALALYRTLGFAVHHTDVALRRQVPGRPDQNPETPTTRPMP